MTLSTFIGDFFTQLDTLLKEYVYNGYMAVSHFISVPLGIIAMIYIAIFGYGVTSGIIKLHFSEFVKTALKIAFIYVAATNWGWVSEYVVGFVNGVAGGISDALVNADPIHIGGATDIDSALQVMTTQFYQLGLDLFKAGGIGGYISSIFIWGFGICLIGLAVFEIALAKIMLAVLFTLTPLFVCFCFFKSTMSFFDRWLGAMVSNALLMIFVSSILALVLSLTFWSVSGVINHQGVKIGFYGVLPVLIVGIVGVGLILKAAHMAEAIGGTASSSSSGSALVGGVIGGAIGASASSYGTARDIYKKFFGR